MLVLLAVAPWESYVFDFENPENHGDFLVAMLVNEKVANGKKQVSSIIIAKPNTHPAEVPFLKAVSIDDSIILTSLAHKYDFIRKKKQWLDILKDNSDALNSEVLLVTTMTSLCTKLVDNGDDDDKKKAPTLKTTTITGFNKAGFSLAHDYFTVGNDGELDLLPLPYHYSLDGAEKKFTYSECMVIWRAYIDGTKIKVKAEKKKNASGNAAMDRLTALMKGTKI